MNETVKRCAWAGPDPLYLAYHDEEWGVPCREDRRLFEFLLLEGAQAGLSWITVLRKREHYRCALDGFDPEKIARYTSRRIDRLMKDPGLVRNRLKLESTVHNARAFIEVRERHGSFSTFIWDFVDGEPLQNRWPDIGRVPASTELSQSLSRELKRLGFRFVGPTICYAFMQAVGLVNDHTVDCFRHAELGGGPVTRSARR